MNQAFPPIWTLQAVNPAVRGIVSNALLEDLGQGDATTDNLPELARIHRSATLRTRETCILSGLEVSALCFEGVDAELKFTPAAQNGDRVAVNGLIATIEGSMASILKAERTALNFLQHLSGIATETKRYVDALAGTSSKITNTRKTTPGLRLLEQQAVKHGGGSPHRYNLSSCVMLKDNHWQALSFGKTSEEEGFRQAVAALRGRLSHTMKVEIEVDCLDQLELALSVGADIILLDNMSPEEIRQAIATVNGRAILEASGGISLATVRNYGETGVPYISTSKITLGVAAIDIGLDLDE
jgi:nicotinate-nucleotide pyrophosphorylase (carboxylating)